MCNSTRTALLAFLIAGSAASAQTATMPPHNNTFNGNTRGYFFTAPTSFRITGVQVLQQPGGTNAFQNWAIVRFHNQTPPPLFNATTNDFDQLAIGLDLPANTHAPVNNIEIQAGDVIGIYGNTVANQGGSPGANSYTATTAPATTEVLGNPITLFRSGMQFHLGSGAVPNMQDIWHEAINQVTRIEFTYAPIDPNAVGACCFPDGSCDFITYAACGSGGGNFAGENITCAAANCPQPGACCFQDGSCESLFETVCIAGGGAWHGIGSDCATTPCPQPGACCFNFDPCEILGEAQCAARGGTFLGSGEICDSCPPAQSSTVVPQSHIAITGNGGFNTLLRTGAGNDRIHQVIWGESTLAAAGIAPGTMITGLTYRGSSVSSGTNWPPSTTIWPNYEIRIGPAAFPPTGMSTTFDSNFASAPLLARSGPLEIAPDTYTATTTIPPTGSPALPWGVEIPLQTPFTYDGGDLIIETRVTASTSHTVSLFVDSLDEAASGAGANGYRTVAAAGLGTLSGTFAFSSTPITRITYDDGTICYANCDGSTGEPILTVDDFTCFINEFAAAQSLPHEQQVTHYANCDGSTGMPALTVDDFTCFINEFAQGCP